MNSPSVEPAQPSYWGIAGLKAEKTEDPLNAADTEAVTATRVSPAQKKALAAIEQEGVKLTHLIAADKQLAVTEVAYGGKSIRVQSPHVDKEGHADRVLRAASELVGGSCPQYARHDEGELKRRQLENLTPEQTVALIKLEKDGARILDADKPLPVPDQSCTVLRYRGQEIVITTPLAGEEHSRLVVDQLEAVRDAVHDGQMHELRRNLLGLDFKMDLDDYTKIRGMLSQAEFAGIELSRMGGRIVACKESQPILTLPVAQARDLEILTDFIHTSIGMSNAREWRAAQSSDVHQLEVHDAQKLSQDMLENARKELEAAGVPPDEIALRLRVMENTRDGKMFFPDPVKNLPEVRNPDYWQLNADGRYVSKGSAVEAIYDLWNTQNAMQCFKYSSVIMLKSMLDIAYPGQLQQMDYLLNGKEIPAVLPDSGAGIFCERVQPKNGKTFKQNELLPGDQIWLNNPYFDSLSAKDRENPRYRGEQGSNVFYVGDGKVMTIYGGKIMPLKEYQQHMFGWNSVHDRDRSRHPSLSSDDFQICGVRRPKARWDLLRQLAEEQVAEELAQGRALYAS